MISVGERESGRSHWLDQPKIVHIDVDESRESPFKRISIDFLAMSSFYSFLPSIYSRLWFNYGDSSH